MSKGNILCYSLLYTLRLSLGLAQSRTLVNIYEVNEDTNEQHK